VAVMAGVALAFRGRRPPRVALTWIGDGATKTAACHEGLNLSAVQRVPAVWIIQNNQVALGTRLERHTPGDLRRWPALYGIPTRSVDGNNVLEVYAATRWAVERCRRGEGPAAVVADTFRMGGHATHDEAEARAIFPPEVFAAWGRRDPVGLFEAYLVEEGVEPTVLEAVEAETVEEVEEAAAEALRSRDLPHDPHRALYEGVSEGGPLVALERRPVGPPFTAPRAP